MSQFISQYGVKKIDDGKPTKRERKNAKIHLKRIEEIGTNSLNKKV